MLNIISAGCAFPSTILTNDFLASLRPEVSREEHEWLTGIHARSSVLPLEYLRSTFNDDVRAALLVASATPTELGAKAAFQALERANLQPESIGMVITDCSTPLETIPGESHRVAGKLGLKVPTFDVTIGASAFALHLKTLLSWRLERLPQYILLVYTNTPTQHLSYRQGYLSSLYGDGAAALIVSPTEQGVFKVERASHGVVKGAKEPFKLGIYAHLEGQFEDAGTLFSDTLMRDLEEVLKAQITPQAVLSHTVHQPLLSYASERLGLAKEQFFSTMYEHGFQMGSTIPSTLAQQWEVLRSCKHIVALQGGASTGHGIVHLKTQLKE